MRDIESRQDIQELMENFYDELLKFADMRKILDMVDIKAHLPNIVHFWSFVLLDEEGYKTNVFEKHLRFPIQPQQFDTWLGVFTSVVDKKFKGEKAELAKSRATVLAYTFKSKWEKLKGPQNQ
jgi:hemoglobin